MVNAKDFFSGNFLKAEDCKGGEIVEFMDGGQMEEIITPEGKTKAVLNFQIKMPAAARPNMALIIFRNIIKILYSKIQPFF